MKNRKWIMLLSLMVLVWLVIKSAAGIGKLFSAGKPGRKACSPDQQPFIQIYELV